MRLRDLGWRIKIPLAITTLIVLTEVVLTATFVSRVIADSRRDLQTSAANLGSVLARSLREPLLRDDLWQAFEVIRTPLAVRTTGNPLDAIVVLDARGRVFVSTEPTRMPPTTGVDELPRPLRALAAAAPPSTSAAPRFSRAADEPVFVARTEVRADDGSAIGAVLLAYDSEVEDRRVQAAIREIALVSVPGMLLLIPLGWFWGKRIAEPLAALASTLHQVGKRPASELAYSLPSSSGDEIGQLAGAARRMLDELARKEALEREVVAAERLAAVGRVSAGVAHEINNPLGGMLNAIDTLETHGQPDPFVRRTLGLVKRGLEQIRSTVAALLVEARFDAPRLHAQDWHDLRLLVRPQASARSVEVAWTLDDRLTDAATQGLPLPAHQIRQLVLNLLLNAIAACPVGLRVEVSAGLRDDDLALCVLNPGDPIPPERMAQLFEPYVPATGHDGSRTRGLGLWVSYQIVRQLGGSIAADRIADRTRFDVRLPIGGRPAVPEPPASEG